MYRLHLDFTSYIYIMTTTSTPELLDAKVLVSMMGIEPSTSN